MDDEPKLEHLSGATIDQINVDWRNGGARITFLSSSRMPESYALRATDFARIDVPRSGHASSTILGARHQMGANQAAVEITMESGEVLRFEAVSFALEGIGGGSGA